MNNTELELAKLVARLVEHLEGSVEVIISEGICDRDDCTGDFELIKEAREYIKDSQ